MGRTVEREALLGRSTAIYLATAAHDRDDIDRVMNAVALEKLVDDAPAAPLQRPNPAGVKLVLERERLPYARDCLLCSDLAAA